MRRRPIQLTSYLNGPSSCFSTFSSPYVCLHCRHHASLRQPSLLPAVLSISIHRRNYATEPTIPDKFQAFFNRTVGKRLFKDGKIPTTEEEIANRPEKEPAIPPSNEQPTDSIDDDPFYTPATSGVDLEAVGGPIGWWEKAWDEEHQYQGWMRPTPMQDGREIKAAIERAFVEWYTVEKGSIKFRETVGAAHRLWANDRSWELLPVGGFKLWQKKNGKVQLEWERQEDKMEMQRWLLEPFETSTEATQLEHQTLEESDSDDPGMTATTPPTNADHLDNAENELEEPVDEESNNLVDRTLEQDRETQASQKPRRAKKARPNIKYNGIWGDGDWGSISLHKHDLKFTVIKRVMQLTGIRIPDSAIQSIDSSTALWHQLIQKPKPKKLAQILIEGYEPSAKKERKFGKVAPFAHLPNVKLLPTKYVPSMAETALGRQKVIDQQLEEHGIPVPFHDEMEQITALEEERLRRRIDAMTEDDRTEARDMWGQELLQDGGKKVHELQK
ncbi:MAG: hypothetical protein Q9209_006380 [Squamulea sp. 1 TL-2023]